MAKLVYNTNIKHNIPRNCGHGLIFGFSTIFQVCTKINMGGDRKVPEIFNLALNLGSFYGIGPKIIILAKIGEN